jgi:hypothetical protein
MREYNSAVESFAVAVRFRIQAEYATSLNNANIHASRLASYGIIVPSTPPFSYIPPLSMRLEVDAERAANLPNH